MLRSITGTYNLNNLSRTSVKSYSSTISEFSIRNKKDNYKIMKISGSRNLLRCKHLRSLFPGSSLLWGKDTLHCYYLVLLVLQISHTFPELPETTSLHVLLYQLLHFSRRTSRIKYQQTQCSVFSLFNSNNCSTVTLMLEIDRRFRCTHDLWSPLRL